MGAPPNEAELLEVVTDAAPAPRGSYAQGYRVGPWVFTAGQTGRAIEGGGLDGRFEAQVTRAIRNLSSVLAAAGVGMDRVVKTTCYLADMDDFASFDEIYSAEFGGHRPARTTIAVELPPGVRFEIEAVAFAEIPTAAEDSG